MLHWFGRSKKKSIYCHICLYPEPIYTNLIWSSFDSISIPSKSENFTRIPQTSRTKGQGYAFKAIDREISFLPWNTRLNLPFHRSSITTITFPAFTGEFSRIVPGPSISHTSNETGWPVEGKTILNRFGYLNGPANTGSKKRSSSWTKHLWAARTCYTPSIWVFTLRFTRDFIDKGGRIDFKDRSIRATCCDDHRFRCD